MRELPNGFSSELFSRGTSLARDTIELMKQSSYQRKQMRIQLGLAAILVPFLFLLLVAAVYSL